MDTASFDTLFDRYSDIAQANDFITTWSIYEVEDVNEKIPFRDMVGKRLVYKYWDENFVDQVVETVIQGDTWLDAWRAADQLLKDSKDFHIFVEDFRMLEDTSLELITGS
jgi:hypothetical protein